MTTKTRNATTTSRYTEIKTSLEDRRSELMNNLRERIRHVRADGTEHREVLDEGESSDIDIQEDVELALIQLRSETLAKINDALRRLDQGTYGYCLECGEAIAMVRLSALPFAVRCKDCEEAREITQQEERLLARRRSPALAFDLYN